VVAAEPDRAVADLAVRAHCKCLRKPWSQWRVAGIWRILGSTCTHPPEHRIFWKTRHRHVCSTMIKKARPTKRVPQRSRSWS